MNRENLPELPWSPEAEQSLLGSMLLGLNAAARVADRPILAEHFFDPRHAIIWTAMARMAARGLPVDVVTVYEDLQAGSLSEAAGGLPYLSAIAQCVPSAANAARYADIVIEKAMRRTIIDAATRAQELAVAPGDADSALDKVAALFASIKRTTARGEPRRIAELLAARIDHWTQLSEGEIDPGVSTGLQNLDEALSGGIKPGKVIVLAARPSIGKTSLAQAIGLNVAASGKGVLFLSQEMPAGDLVDRAVANLGGVALDRILTGRFKDADWTQISEATDEASRLPLMVDDQPALSLLDIRSKVRIAQHRLSMQGQELVLVVVDYVQLCAAAGGEKRHHQIEQISRGMKTLAKEAGCCVLLLSQLNRSAEEDEPELFHLKESGAIEEDADTVILLHPMGQEPDGSQIVLAKVPKNRQGLRGRLALSFQGKTQRWASSRVDVSRRKGGA